MLSLTAQGSSSAFCYRLHNLLGPQVIP